MTTSVSPSTTYYSNVTHNISTTGTITSMVPVWIRILTLICMILIDISAFFGNLLVICAFFRTRRLQTVTNYFIASLAFADALVAVFVLPLSVYYYQRDRSWKLGLILCDLWVSSDVLLCTSSILNLTCISVDRYMAITKPLTYTAYRSKFLARIMILLVWIVSAVITCPPIFGWRDKNRRHTVEQEYKCDLNTARGYVVYSALGSFYIPGVIMIFVYIRIFMVVYDRENLIKSFRDTNNSTTNHNRSLSTPVKSAHHRYLSNNKPTTNSGQNKQTTTLSSCCFCCRRLSHDNSLLKTSIPSYSYSRCPNVEQKQNGCLIYRFTNNNNNNNNNNHSKNQTTSTNMHTNSIVHSQLSNSKTSIDSRSCHNSTKILNNIVSDDIYPYRRPYLTHNSSEYQFQKEDSSSYESKTVENNQIPLIKRRSRSFEHSCASKVRDLNSELSHSRQIKTAVAGVITKSNTGGQAKPQNENELLVLSNDENDVNHLCSSISETLNRTSQSLNELVQLSARQSLQAPEQIDLLPLRTRSTTNPSLIQKPMSHSLTDSCTNPRRQYLPEPTRINRRAKSSRLLKNSPSALSMENAKQLSRTGHQPSTSLSVMQNFVNRDHNLNDAYFNKARVRRYCCCCCYSNSSMKQKPHSIKVKQIFNSTPSHSLTNDDEDDDKISSNDTTNRTPSYTPVSSATLPRTHVRGNSNAGDVHRRERIRFMKEQKTAKTLAVVVGGFILFWLPFFIMYVIPQEKHSLSDYTVTLITWLGYFNSVINPFIYAYCSKQFRMAFWNITFGLCMKRSSALVPLAQKHNEWRQKHINA